jgi:Transposase DDE domain
VTLATTLIDDATYPAAELAELYFRRWAVETHLRDLKQTMGRMCCGARAWRG